MTGAPFDASLQRQQQSVNFSWLAQLLSKSRLEGRDNQKLGKSQKRRKRDGCHGREGDGESYSNGDVIKVRMRHCMYPAEIQVSTSAPHRIFGSLAKNDLFKQPGRRRISFIRDFEYLEKLPKLRRTRSKIDTKFPGARKNRLFFSYSGHTIICKRKKKKTLRIYFEAVVEVRN